MWEEVAHSFRAWGPSLSSRLPLRLAVTDQIDPSQRARTLTGTLSLQPPHQVNFTRIRPDRMSLQLSTQLRVHLIHRSLRRALNG